MNDDLQAVVTETVLGFASVVLSPVGIRGASLFHRTRAAAEREMRATGASSTCEDERADAVASALARYTAGEASALEAFPVDLPPSTPMQQRIWLSLREIPAGETRSYGWLARQHGLPSGAARAVGAAVGANPIPLWLPCHRVVASDGTLHGFGGGLAMKQALLELEGALPRRII